MALSSAWCLVLPLGLLWGAAGSREAQGDDKAFPFDVEESSAVGRHDPPETSEPRVVPGRLPPTAETCGAGFFLAHSGECLPCDCNGNANECMDGSGLCVVSSGPSSCLTYFIVPLHLGWEWNIPPGRASYLGTNRC
ncbi:laminin subunit alpha 4 [Phyllostomus discolor]|uniref:Laminin subunit alpha 4 n=1 Tax=Phyllostomus discolor TaxID=89673 RepID=A0A834AMS6_9CHIR|nr:laminin subunit alpha 4 [Phyllostomus discolor]